MSKRVIFNFFTPIDGVYYNVYPFLTGHMNKVNLADFSAVFFIFVTVIFVMKHKLTNTNTS